jgi:hypothetical protein
MAASTIKMSKHQWPNFGVQQPSSLGQICVKSFHGLGLFVKGKHKRNHSHFGTASKVDLTTAANAAVGLTVRMAPAS